MIGKLFKWYEWGKLAYQIAKPVYLELRKDAYEFDEKQEINKTKKKRKTNAVDKKSERSH